MARYSAAHYSFCALVSDYGYEDVIAALIEEYKTAPDDQLVAIEALLDVALVDLLKAGEGGETLRRTIAQ